MIYDYENLTNPGLLPVEGDVISFVINGVSTQRVWNLETFNVIITDAFDRSNAITPLEFRRLFPSMSMLAIDGFENDTSITEAQKDVVRSYLRTFDSATEIHLTNEDVQGALSLFVSLGWMTEQEKDHVTRNGIT